MAPYKQVSLTAEQAKKWDATRVAFLFHNPAFAAVFYQMMNNCGSEHIALFTDQVPIAATDGSNLLLNPETFFGYTLSERVFIVSHEVAHGIFNHMGIMHHLGMRGKVSFTDGSNLPYDHDTMNRAMDYVINDMLIESRVGTYNKDWLHDTSIAVHTDSAIDAYKKVYDDQKGKGRGRGGGGNSAGNGSGQGQFDQHLPPGSSQGKDPVTAAAQRQAASNEWGTVVAGAAQAAKVQGKLPGAMQRFLDELLNPQVDWKDKIAALMHRKLGSGGYSWRRPDRNLIVRDIYAPGRTGFGCGTVVVGVDTSGSVGDKELAMFFAEMAGILEDCQPQRLVVIWCDAKVHRVDEVEDVGDLAALRAKGAPGGGGTSFIPVFEKIDELGLEPEALVYLTDGLGSFPKSAPRYPTIWGNIYPSSKYPFGDVVDVPKQA